MSAKGNEKRDFPKNIRQIGEGAKEKRVYLEDYAITYLRQVKGAVLLGESVRIKGIRCYFISGAIEVPDGNFNEENWEYVRKEAEESFAGLSVMGWYLKAEEIPEALNEEDMQVYREHFPGQEAILVVYNELEKEEGVYLTLDGFLRRQSGYYIYYEKNPCMQDYLVGKNEGRQVEKEAVVSDEAIQSFRKIIESKYQKKNPSAEGIQKEAAAEKPSAKSRTMQFLYAASTFMVLTILVIGVTMINNYDKMKEMEQTIAYMTENLPVAAEPKTAETESETEWETETEQETPAMRQTVIDARTGETELLEGVLSESEMPLETETGVEAAAMGQQEGEILKTETEAKGEEISGSALPVHATQATYTVKFGDTLADICARYYGTTERLQEICDLNHITDPNAIMPGEKLVLP